MKNAVGQWGLTYTSVREKLGLKTIKMADGLVNKDNKGKRHLILTSFFFFLIFNFSYCDSHGSHPGSHGSHGSHDSHGSHPGSHDSHGSHCDSHGSLARTLVRLVSIGASSYCLKASNC